MSKESYYDRGEDQKSFPLLSNRLGMFKISNVFLETYRNAHTSFDEKLRIQKALQLLFKDMIIVSTSMEYEASEGMCVVYKAFSDKFLPIPEGALIPTYRMIIKEHEGQEPELIAELQSSAIIWNDSEEPPSSIEEFLRQGIQRLNDLRTKDAD